MPLGMLCRSIARGVKDRRRRRPAAERPVVAHIGPEAAGDRLALGQDRHRRVVAMEPLGRQDVAPGSAQQRLQHRRAGADLVGQRRHAQIDALAAIALALPVQRLMLAEFVEQDHRQQIRPGTAARVGWNGAGGWVIVSQARHENFSRTVWITFQWRGITSSVSVISSPSLASFADRSRDSLRRGDNDAFARQMSRQWFARRPLALERCDRLRPRRGLLGRHSSSVAAASRSSSCISIWSSSRALRSERLP